MSNKSNILSSTKRTQTLLGLLAFLLFLVLITYYLTLTPVNRRINDTIQFATAFEPALNISITYPSQDNAVGFGLATITATVSEPERITGVRFFIHFPGSDCTDGLPDADICIIHDHNTGNSDITAAPYSIIADSTQVPDGQYTIYATAYDNNGNTATAERIVQIQNNPPPSSGGGGGFDEPVPPPIVPIEINFAASSTSVNQGSSTSLFWETTGADSCNITKDNIQWGTGTSSSQYSPPLSSGPIFVTTNFQITCTNSNNSASKSIDVSIALIRVVTLNLTSATTSVLSGSSTTISWDTTSADSCNVLKNGTSFSTATSSNGISSGALSTTTNFIATCLNNDSSETKSITINIIGESLPPPPPPSNTVQPPRRGGQIGGGGDTEVMPIIIPTSSTSTSDIQSPSIVESIKQSYDQAVIVVEEVVQKAAEVAEESLKVTKEIVNTPTGSVVTKAVSTTGIVAGASASIGTVAFANPVAIAEIWLIPAKLFGILMGALGIRKKGRQWGTVFDSVTKRPLDPVYVSLIDTETDKEISGAITDIDGRYGFSVLPGKYKIQVKKTNYISPSVIMKGRFSDEVYNDLYFGEELQIKSGGEIITKNIPMDSLSFDWNEFAKTKMNVNTFIKTKDILWAKISNILFALGSIISLVAVIAAPAPYNIIIAVFYVIAYIVNNTVWKTKKSGILREKKTNIPLSFAIVKIYREGETAPAVKKIADKFGAYYSLVPNGRYFLEIDKKNDDATYTNVLRTEIMDIKNGIINSDFEL